MTVVSKALVLAASHGAALALGIAGGIYLLPILTAPAGASTAAVEAALGAAEYTAKFERDIDGSDFLHWGEGRLALTRDGAALQGRVAPGPDYKLYFVPEPAATAAQFLALKDRSLRAAEVKTFENFMVGFAEPVDLSRYRAVVIWCETFSQFITAATYR